MNDLFIKLLNMSITASILALAVMLVRLVFKKMPKKISVLLWGLVALRLLLPFSIQSPLSLIPQNMPFSVPETAAYTRSRSAVTISPAKESSTAGVAESGAVNTHEKPGSSEQSELSLPVLSNQAEEVKKDFPVFGTVWLAGVGAMLAYAAISFIRLKRKISASIRTESGVYICDDISTPFILGVFSPDIFLPSALTEEQRRFVLSHEKTHIKRLDTLWKPLGYMLLSFYWFNPVIWLAYILLCRDIELACDEKVIENMEKTDKADYSQALLDCSRPRKSIAACPLAFGENGVKTRVKNILNYKKPAFWVIAAAVVVCIALAVFFLTDPLNKNANTPEPTSHEGFVVEWKSGVRAEPEPKETLDAAVHEVLIKRHLNSYRGEFLTEGHVTLGTDETDGGVKVYLLTDVTSYGFQNGYFTEVGGSMVPTVLVFRTENGLYVLEECIEAEDGNYYAPSIKNMYPSEYHSRVLGEGSEADRKSMCYQCIGQAQAYLENMGRAEEIRPWSEVPHIMLIDEGITVEVDEKINDAMRYIDHYEYLGYEERLENGVRYIYTTTYDTEKSAVIFTKKSYETGETLYTYAFDSATGDILRTQLNVAFSQDVKLNADDPCRAQMILSAVYSMLENEYCAEDECWVASVSRAEEIPLGMAGLNDGMNVYEIEYLAERVKNGGSGETANDTAIAKKEYTGYCFIYWRNDVFSCADLMTYDEIREAFLNEQNAGDNEALLRTAAGYYISEFRSAE